MKKTISTTANILNWVVLVLLIAVVVLHVMPYWQYEAFDILTGETSDATSSIQGYVWCSFNHLDLEDGFTSVLRSQKLITGKYWINDYILSPILAFLPAAVGIILCIFKRKSLITGILPVVSGAAGIVAFTSNDIIVNEKILEKFGGASFMNPTVGIIASVVTLVLGAVLLALRVVEFIQKKKQSIAL